jgi:PASTA domain/Penicillin binding protein transpeptidase domain
VQKTAPKGQRLLYQHEPRCKQVVDPEVAHLVTAMLQRVVCCGTGEAANLPGGRPVAGKTGTSQDYTNVYFAGYTPQVATAVWVGFSEGQRPMDSYYGTSVFGGTIAAPIWQDFMERAMQGFSVQGFEAPPPPESGGVPDVVGLKLEQAEVILAEANFTTVSEMVVSFEPRGTVLSQAPGGGTRARLGSAVNLRVSDGRGEPVVVPKVTGMTEARAIDKLARLDLLAEVELTSVNRANLDGIVVDQYPSGNGTKLVDPGSTVTLFVGRFQGDGGGGDGGGGGGGGDGGGGGGDGDGNGNGGGGGNGNGGGNDGGGGPGNGLTASMPVAARRRTS